MSRAITKPQIFIAISAFAAITLFAVLSLAFGNGYNTPTILSASVSSTKVIPGDTMLITAEIADVAGIQSVTADMAGIETLQLKLTSGTIHSGTWQAQWLVHSTENKDYVTTITATNALGKFSQAAVEWSDPATWTVGSGGDNWTTNTTRTDVTEDQGDHYIKIGLFADNFDDGNEDWSGQTVNVVNGKLNVTGLAYLNVYHASFLVANHTLFAKINVTNGEVGIGQGQGGTLNLYSDLYLQPQYGVYRFYILLNQSGDYIGVPSLWAGQEKLLRTDFYWNTTDNKQWIRGKVDTYNISRNATLGGTPYLFIGGDTRWGYPAWVDDIRVLEKLDNTSADSVRTDGNLTSIVKDAQAVNSSGSTWQQIKFEGEVPINTTVDIYINTSSDGSSYTGYQLVRANASANVFYELPVANKQRHASWRLLLNASLNNSYTPVIYNVSMETAITPPQISFVSPTDTNNAYVSRNYSYVNVTVSDTDNTTSFIDWNRSLVGWWRFESVNASNYTLDNSSWRNDGKLYNFNTNPPQTTTGKFGNALQFDGNNTYVSIPSLSTTSANWSLEGWINPKVGDNTENHPFGLSPTNIQTWVDAGNTYQFLCSGDYATYTSLSYGVWSHIVLVANSSRHYLYVNGILRGSGAGICPSIIGFKIGQYINGGYTFNGSIDEVRIWNRVLSPEEINASYNSGLYRLYRNFTSLADGQYQYYAASQDLAGNVNTTETRTLTVDTTPPYSVNACGDLTIANGVYNLISNVSSSGTCFNILANNITLDGQGYWVNYSAGYSGSTVYYGINDSDGYDNITIKNLNIVQGSVVSSGQPYYSHAMYFNNAGNVTLYNNTMKTTSYESQCIYYMGGNTFNFTANTINTTHVWGATAIYLRYAYNGVVSNNNITTLYGDTLRGNGIYFLDNCDNITLLNNIVSVQDSNAIRVNAVSTDSNIDVIGGSYMSTGTGNAYYFTGAGNYSSFTNTNFTAARKIYFADTTSWFIYRNDTATNIWLKTSVSAANTLTRTLINWNNTLMKWNDTNSTANIIANYNLTGLLPSTTYNIYNTSGGTQTNSYSLTTDSAGALSFNIRLNGNTEIKAEAVPPYGLNSCQDLTIANGNYVLTQNVSSAGTCFNILANNVTLDGNGYWINYSQSAVGYAINNTGGYDNITIRNCNIVQGSSVSNAHAIYGSGMGNSTITNNTIKTSGSSSHGILLYTENDLNNVSKNSITLLGNDATGIYVWDFGDNNTISGNIINNSGGAGSFWGIGIWLRNWCQNNLISNNTITVSGTTNHGIWNYLSSDSNKYINNIIRTTGTSGYGFFIESSSSNNITGGSVISENSYDYYFFGAGTTNNFTNTNFTASRKIYFNDATPGFNYNNETTGNIWLKTSVSAANTLTRTLTTWSQSIMQWNDTSSAAVTVNYNLTGLYPNAQYNISNNSVVVYQLTTDSQGALSFTIYFSAAVEREIKVQNIPPAGCDYGIYELPYVITQNNSIYCLNSNLYIGGQNAINFTSGVQNTTLDCKGFNIDGNDTTTPDTYGVYLTGSSTKNNTVRNCNVTDFDNGIYLTGGSNNNIITNNTGKSNYGAFVFWPSSSNIIANNTADSNTWGFIFGISGSGNNNLTNNLAYNNNYGFDFESGSDNNRIINNTAYGNSDFGIRIYNTASNNYIEGGSYHSNTQRDYYLYIAGTTNNFTNTNFTAARKIYFDDVTSWFNYRNDTVTNIWLKTNVSAANTLTRTLTTWSQPLMKWNDTNSTAGITARYNITGLFANNNYAVYNTSGGTQTNSYNLTTDAAGALSFTIALNGNTEIKVQDSQAPSIQFISPTDTNNAYVNRNYSYVNVSVSDASNTTSFIDWNRSLVGWWRFESVNTTNHTVDNSTWRNDGKLYNGSTSCYGSAYCPQLVSGKFGNALQFDGSNDYVDAGNDASLSPTTKITVEAWVKTSNTKAVQFIAGHGSTGYIGWNLDIEGGNTAYLQVGNGTGSGWTSQTYSTGTWSHIVGVYNGSTITVFVNGVAGTPVSFSGNIDYTGVPNTWIGQIQGSGGTSARYFNGSIDEVKIWNRALSPEEINASYNSKIHCYDNETEVLTEEGWKYFKDVTFEDKIATLNTTSSKVEYHAPEEIQNYDYSGEMYRIETESGELVVSPEHKVYGSLLDRNIANSFVVSTPTIDCPFSNFSSDQTGQENFNANARYGASLACPGNNLSAFGMNISNSSFGTSLILLSNIESNLENSSSVLCVFDNISSLLLENSTNMNSGAISCILSENNMPSESLVPLISKENNSLASTTTNIYLPLFNPYLLANASFTFPPSLNASSFVNSLLDLNSLRNSRSAIFCKNACLATSDQFIILNSTILRLSSSGTDRVKFAISNTSNVFTHINYVCSHIYKPFGYGFSLLEISDAYSQLSDGKQLIFLDENLNPIAVDRIEKVPYSGRIYDVTVPNHILLVKRDNLITWSGNSLYHNFSSLSDGTYQYYAASQDLAGNVNTTETRTLTVDTVKPTISFVSPTDTDNTYVSRNYSYVNVTVNDTESPNNTTSFIDWNRSLVGWWRLESVNATNHTVDNSTWRNDGQLATGGEAISSKQVTGKFGNALQFDGSDDYVQISDSSNLNITNAITLQAWVKPRAGYGESYPRIIDKIDGVGGYTIWVEAATGDVDFKLNISGTARDFLSTDSLPLDVWTLVTATYNGTTAKIYFNGVEELSNSNYPGSIDKTAKNLYIGDTGDTTRVFNGTIDEVKIWSRALSPEEINASYNSGLYRLYHNFTNLTDGQYQYYAASQDLAGNVNTTETRTLTVDTVKPTITIYSPENATTSDNTPLLNATSSDTNPSQTWYKLDSGSNETHGCSASACLVNLSKNWVVGSGGDNWMGNMTTINTAIDNSNNGSVAIGMFYDTFTEPDGNAVGWDGTGWSVSNNTYGKSQTGVSTSYVNVNYTDYNYSAKIKVLDFQGGVWYDARLEFRYNGTYGEYRSVIVQNETYNNIQIIGYNDATIGGGNTGFYYSDNVWYNMRVEIYNVNATLNTIKAKIWRDGTSEPEWHIQTNHSGSKYGKIGLSVRDSYTIFDDVRVWNTTSGNLTSVSKDAQAVSGTGSTWQQIKFTGEVPINTTVDIYVNTSIDGSSYSGYQLVKANATANTFYELPTANKQRYATWRLLLNATLNSSYTPTIQNVTMGASLIDGSHSVTVYANDTAGNENSTARWFTVDVTPPIITIANPQNTSYGSLPIQLNITTNEAVNVCKYNLNNTANSTMQNSSQTSWFFAAGLRPPLGTHRLYVYCNDTSGNEGVNNSVWFTYALINPPKWILNTNTTTPTSPSDYTQNFSAQIDWESTSFANATLQLGRPTGLFTNYTIATTPAVLNTGQTWYINITVPQRGNAGTYNYTWFGMNTTGAQNKTGTFSYVVNPSVAAMNIYVNSLLSNATVTYPAQTTVTANETNLYDDDLTYNFYRNDILLSSGSSITRTEVLSNATWIFRYNTTGNANWTLGNATIRTVFVNKGTMDLSVASNGTQTYPYTSTAEGWENNIGDTDVTYWLTRNGLLVDSAAPWFETNTLGVGTYVYRFNTSSGTNYANWTANATGVTTTLTINKGLPILNIYIDDIQQNKTVTYPTSVTVRANETNAGDTDCQYNLYRNDLLLLTGSDVSRSEILGNNTWIFRYNTSGGANWSLTNATIRAVQVLQNQTNPVDIYLINSTNTYKNQNITAIAGGQTTANVTAIYSNSGTVSLYLDNALTNNPNTTILSFGEHSYKGNVTGNANYTSNFTGATYYIKVIDTTPPTYTNVGQNVSAINESGVVLFYAQWSDNVNLSTAILSTNESGVWQNKTTYSSPVSFSSASGWSNFTWSNASVKGKIVGWRIYANDSAGNQNVTAINAFAVYKRVTVRSLDKNNNYKNSTIKILNTTDSDAAAGISNATGYLETDVYPRTYDISAEVHNLGFARIKSIDISLLDALNISFDNNTLSTSYPQTLSVIKKVFFNVSQQLGSGYTLNISASAGLTWQKCLSPPCTAAGWSTFNPSSEGTYINFYLTYSDPELIGGTAPNIRIVGYALYSKTGLPMANANVTAVIRETGDITNTTTDSAGSFDLWFNAVLQQGRTYTVAIKVVDSQGKETYLIERVKR